VLNIVSWIAELSSTLSVRTLIIGCIFRNPPESIKSNVDEDPGCPRVEIILSFKDRRLCLAVEILSV
jgi:hypothetical protein